MTEREKMDAGQWYDANYDKELLEERLEADRLCYTYNHARPGSDEQAEALKGLLKTDLPDGLSISPMLYFDYGSRTHFGKGCFVNHGAYFMDGGGIYIGDNAYIGPFCGFYTASHPLKFKDRNKGLEKASPIHIGDNCWLGANVSIMPGVTIGNGCVIAAGSVVTKDIPDNCLAAGVPAQVKKKIDQE